MNGLGQIGCTPKELATYGNNGSACVQFINDEVQLFNDKLKFLLDDLNSNLTNATFIYVNTSGIQSTDPALTGNYIHRYDLDRFGFIRICGVILKIERSSHLLGWYFRLSYPICLSLRTGV